MSIKLADARRQRLIEGLEGFYRREFDEEISTFRAGLLLDFFLDALGPQVYNQAVQDAVGSCRGSWMISTGRCLKANRSRVMVGVRFFSRAHPAA